MATSAEGMQSDEVIDFKCSFCLRKGKVKHSEKFCVECKQQLCSECLQLHNHLLDGHTLLEPARSTGQPILPTDRCEKHGDKVIEMFCEDHDEVGCNTCAYMDHRLCKTVLNIPSDIQKLFNMDNIKHVSKELEKVRINIAKRKELRSKHREALKVEREANLTKVEEYTEKLVAIIQALGTATKASLMKEYDEEDKRIQTYETKCKTIERNMQKCLQQLKNDNETHVQLFISMKEGQKLLIQADHISKETDDIIKKGSPYFMVDEDEGIKTYLTGFETYKTIKQPIMHKIKEKREINVQPIMYKIKEKREINVKIKEDSRGCWIWDSCLLPDNTLLITDMHNKKLKHVDTTVFNIKDHCDLPDNPCGVCCMSQQEAAVCLENKTIQFISLSNKLTLTRSIKQNFACVGISYRDNKFYVTTRVDQIKVLNKEGDVIQTLSALDAKSLSKTLKISVHELDGKLFIADWNNGLICTDPSGHQLFQYKGRELQNCTGVCTDGRGIVFVSGFNSNNVVQVTANGEYLGEVLSASSGLLEPLSLSWDGKRRRLYVTTANNTVYVLDMTYGI